MELRLLQITFTCLCLNGFSLVDAENITQIHLVGAISLSPCQTTSHNGQHTAFSLLTSVDKSFNDFFEISALNSSNFEVDNPLRETYLCARRMPDEDCDQRFPSCLYGERRFRLKCYVKKYNFMEVSSCPRVNTSTPFSTLGQYGIPMLLPLSSCSSSHLKLPPSIFRKFLADHANQSSETLSFNQVVKLNYRNSPIARGVRLSEQQMLHGQGINVPIYNDIDDFVKAVRNDEILYICEGTILLDQPKPVVVRQDPAPTTPSWFVTLWPSDNSTRNVIRIRWNWGDSATQSNLPSPGVVISLRTLYIVLPILFVTSVSLTIIGFAICRPNFWSSGRRSLFGSRRRQGDSDVPDMGPRMSWDQFNGNEETARMLDENNQPPSYEEVVKHLAETRLATEGQEPHREVWV